MSDGATEYTKDGQHTSPLVIVVIVLLVVFGVVFFTGFMVLAFKPTYATGYIAQDPSPAGQNPPTEFSACRTAPECISNPADYASALSNSNRNGFFGAACVSDTILGRVVAVSGNSDTNWNPTTLGRTGAGSRIVFAISASTLEKMLPLGNRDATSIVRTLGFGDGYTCGSAGKNYSDCQYRLILWSAPCLKTRPPITQGYWLNLEWFLRTYVYGANTPSLGSAMKSIQEANGLLSNITGCNELFTPDNFWNPNAQRAAGCSEEFISAMSYFSRSNCNGTNSSSPRYTPDSGCTAENRFLALSEPTAIELRAYLMQNEGFNPYYTGYGYTAGSDFYGAQQEEFWYYNDYISALENSVIVKLYNGTH